MSKGVKRDNAMFRYAFAAAMLVALLPWGSSFAVTPKEKMVTCKFGADDQKLQGAARTKFLKNCMANRNDPRGPTKGSAAAAPPPAAGAMAPPKQ
jgi:hypothetical protein